MELKELSYDSPLGGQFISAALWTEGQAVFLCEPCLNMLLSRPLNEK